MTTDNATDSKDVKLSDQLTRFEIDGTEVIAFAWKFRTRLFTPAGTPSTAGEAAEHDGYAMINGEFRHFAYDDETETTVTASHPEHGECETYFSTNQFQAPITLLTEHDPQ